MRLPLAAVLLAACAPAAPTSVHEGIIGGVRDSGDPAVVLLISYPTDKTTYYTCTASLISPTVLITAAHCVDDANHPGFVYGAYFGDDASAYATAAQFAAVLSPVSSVHAHPSYDPAPPFTADIGVAILSSPSAVSPLPIARTSLPADLPGKPARIVGYGQTVYMTYNAAKYAAATSVLSLPADDTVVVGDVSRHSCVGDSGGPAFAQLAGEETLIGVDSYTDTSGCTEPSHYRRVDQYLPFLDTYAPPPAPDLGTHSDASTVNDAATPSPDASTIARPPETSGCQMGEEGHAPPIQLLEIAVIFGLIVQGLRARRRVVRRASIRQ